MIEFESHAISAAASSLGTSDSSQPSNGTPKARRRSRDGFESSLRASVCSQRSNDETPVRRRSRDEFESSSLRASISSQRSNDGTPFMVQRTSRTSKLADKRLSELTINKLKMQSIGLIGREKETQILQSRLQSMIDQTNNNIRTDDDDDDQSSNMSLLQVSEIKKELVFIKGFSGVGKTSLARVIRKQVGSTKHGFFAEGKFDLDYSKDYPYSGIAKAYGELIRERWSTDRNMMLGIGEKLCSILGSEVEPLIYLIPELEDVVSRYSTLAYSDGSVDGMQDKWKYSFRVLARLLTAHVKPLVLVIDDLQWADKASIDLIECLITDAQNVNPLMVIGCYRSNEVKDTSALSQTIRTLTGKGLEHCFHVTEIALESCGSNEVNQMIMKMMDIDDERITRDLARLCFQRTSGNPFFVIEFMNMLQREELIEFSLGTMKWIFNVSAIEEATMSTANVVETLQSRLQKMASDVQLLLSIAASLGPSFRVSTLEMLWKNLEYVKYNGFDLEDVRALIDFIEREMLIEECAADTYRWVHDKVQEAALLLADIDRNTLSFEIGKIWYLNLKGKDLDDELFDVVDLISGFTKRKSADLASLCLKAATKAMRLSAFAACTRYIQSGIALLPEDMWTNHQSLALGLYTLGAQIELVIGHVDESKKYCEAVLERKEIEMSAKVPLRVVGIKRLSTVELRHSEAISASLSLLKDLKFNFLWSRKLVPAQAIWLLWRTIKDVEQQPSDFYLRLGRMDTKNSIIAEILFRLRYASVQITDIKQVIVSICHVVQLTLHHGLCEQSAPNIALIGSLAIQVFQKYKYAPKFREMALAMQRHYGRPRACQTILNVYNFQIGWLIPMGTGDVFYTGYMKGIQNGEVEHSMFCLLIHFVILPYSLGKPIDQILDSCPNVMMQMEEVSQGEQALWLRSLWQMLLNLRNIQEDQNPWWLRGNVHSIETCNGSPHVLAWHEFAEFQLVLFYDDPSAADRAIESAGDFARKIPGHFTIMIETFHRGVCLYAAARRTKKRKYKRHAKKIRKQIAKWKSVGNPNVVYYSIFLDAEQAALEGKYDKAEEHYKEAIQFVARSGYLHHAALFNEMYSDFLVRERCDRNEAKYRLEEAIRYYEDWGALGKVERLRKSSLLG